MRIGLLIYGSLDTLSGGYLYDRELVRHLRAAGHQVEIFSLPFRSYSHAFGGSFLRSSGRELERASLDLLIQDELCHPSLVGVNRVLRGRFPLISLVHHLRISERHPLALMPLYRAVERAYLKSVDGFIYNSRTTQQVVEDLTGPGRPFVVAHPAGDRLDIQITPEAIRRRAHQAGPLRILFLGNLIPRKGLHTLLAALERLDASSWSLTVVGGEEADPAYARKMRHRVHHLGWEDQVTFTGAVRDERLLPILEGSHVLALPSEYEGFGIAYLEGMGAGLVAIGSRQGAAHEIITDGTTGFLVEPGDAAGLAEHLRALHQDRERLAEMGVQARSTYQSHPTWSQSMERVHQFLLALGNGLRIED